MWLFVDKPAITKCYEAHFIFVSCLALTCAVDIIAGKSCYTVWSGPLVNKGQELFPICLRSSSRPYLPFKL